MIPFNHTFTPDKPIYYPFNWQTGKSDQQLYQQWQQSPQYSLYSNLLQILAAAGWISLLVLLVLGWRQIYKIWVMEESNNKKYFRRYVKVGFVGPVAGLSLLCAGVTLYLITEEWTRMALGKGLVACVIGVGCYWGYRKLNLGRYWKSGRGVYKRLRQTE